MTSTSDTPAPEGLLAALTGYEAALMANDLPALDSAFAPGPATLRGDEKALLVGHDAISSFRSARGGVARRRIGQVEVRELGPHLALVVSVSEFATGGRGLQSQLWRRTDGTWRIEAAHVTSRPAPLDRTIWRAVGDPLMAATGSGPLDGLTVAVKDLYAVPGQPVGAGNPTWLREAAVETEAAAALALLLSAGAAMRGIARTDEFAYSIAGRNEHYGTPPNGVTPLAIPGGSSNGSASAVALGLADIGLGTDTGGSVRVPASYQGLWGLRTTHGLVPRDGLLALAPSFDTVGWLTRDGSVLCRVAGVCLPGVSASEPPAEFLVVEELLSCAEPATVAAFESCLADVGIPVRRVRLAEYGIPEPAALRETFRLVQAGEAWDVRGEWIEAHPGALGPTIAARFAAARDVDPGTRAAAVDRLPRDRDAIRKMVGDGIVALPTVPGPAPLLRADAGALARTRSATLAMTSLAGIGGLPALSVPALTVAGAAGQPTAVGICLVGAAGTDRGLVAAATELFDAA
ncbi:AtzH-like domain-containing protein [Amycolatopsis alkalitolerans]|uniref:DUF3225 domain-containing protein n=1 Tax=Amycolatopsis alkalitolerans TaxID=2547244 RepID=A0A5C4LQZ2_9PSEU|nr:AtzH-like domain-containing protein [Amycolatopsis alkalitolerans]TNC21086.1 DUF3225 domain-containing protein [Amycolatopsis alkalitolerans]